MHILAAIVIVDDYVPVALCVPDVAANKTENAPVHMVLMRQLAKRQKSVTDRDMRKVK